MELNVLLLYIHLTASSAEKQNYAPGKIRQTARMCIGGLTCVYIDLRMCEPPTSPCPITRAMSVRCCSTLSACSTVSAVYEGSERYAIPPHPRWHRAPYSGSNYPPHNTTVVPMVDVTCAQKINRSPPRSACAMRAHLVRTIVVLCVLRDTFAEGRMRGRRPVPRVHTI